MTIRARSVMAATLALLVAGADTGFGQQSFEDRRREMQEMLDEIESGEMIYVPYGRTLVPMEREEFVQSLVLAALAPLRAAAAGGLTGGSPSDVAIIDSVLDLDNYRKRARVAWVATEALRRTLRAELDRLAQGRSAFNVTSADSIRGFLEGTWQLDIKLTDTSSDFSAARPMLQGSHFIIDHANCRPGPGQDPALHLPRLRCALTGSFILGAPSSRTVESLRDASFDPGQAVSIRFAVAAPEVGGRLLFMGNLSHDTGWIEEGRLVWSAGTRADTEVGIWTARRAR